MWFESSVVAGAQSVQGEVEEAFGLIALIGLTGGKGDAGEHREHVARTDVRPDGVVSIPAFRREESASSIRSWLRP
jgi:hypothetical protein